MANKRRPKKTRGLHYKKYVYGVQKIEEDEDLQSSDLGVQRSTTTPQTHRKREYTEDWYGIEWPVSRFVKVDVLKVAIALEKGFEVKAIDDLTQPMRLPYELIIEILLRTDKPACLNHLLINKAIYYMLLPKLYECPELSSTNFLKFVDAISIPSNRKKFSHYVKVLDLSHIIQSGKNSYVSKLLRRFSSSLEVFISSQTGFGVSPLVSLRLCSNLKVLDLRLVSETVNLKEMFHAISILNKLEQFSFPRSSMTCENFEIEWPENLWFLRIQGGISNEFITGSWFPSTITSLELSYCPNIDGDSVNDLLMRIGMNLKKLSIFYPMPQLKENSMDTLFLYCPNLSYLYVNIEYISKEIFDDDLLPILDGGPRPLKSLIIDSSRLLGRSKLHPDDILIAVCEERLPNLKRLKISQLLGWDFDDDDVQLLISELEDRGCSLYTT